MKTKFRANNNEDANVIILGFYEIALGTGQIVLVVWVNSALILTLILREVCLESLLTCDKTLCNEY